jgi:hypothetical protein
MFNHDMRAEYLIRNVSDISKKMFDEHWLITKRGYSEIFVPLEGYKSYSEFFTSSLDFKNEKFFSIRVPLSQRNLDAYENELYVDTILDDYRLLNNQIKDMLENCNEEYRKKICNKKIKVLIQEENNILEMYYFVIINISKTKKIRLKFKSLDFKDNSLNLNTYLEVKKILNDNNIEINIEDVEYNLEDIATQLNLLNY